MQYVYTRVSDVVSTTGIDVSQSSNLVVLGNFITNLVPTCLEWTYDFTSGLLTLTTEELITQDLTSLGKLVAG